MPETILYVHELVSALLSWQNGGTGFSLHTA
jgi:hypothetical protein